MESKPWTDISLDMMVRLPVSEGKDSILVVVCRFTKMASLVPIKSNITAKNLAKVFIDNILRHHGVPKTVISDRDSKFVSKFW